MGGKLKDIYGTVGPYDIVTVAEFPDDGSGTAFLLALGSQGNVMTIGGVLDGVAALKRDAQVIVVDDGSNDRTRA
jgi:uncharacterized protein with GYD domain